MELKNVITPKLKEAKEAYVAPMIETLEVKVEQGFQSSLPDGTDRNRKLW